MPTRIPIIENFVAIAQQLQRLKAEDLGRDKEKCTCFVYDNRDARPSRSCPVHHQLEGEPLRHRSF